MHISNWAVKLSNNAISMNVSNLLSQDQGAMMFGGQGVETNQVSIPNNVRMRRLFLVEMSGVFTYFF